ncbi:hypothetical protein [Shewanella sp.]|uniref:hypothetical protein n=1 Tax=Shewanella sp. TaxID=50422 RepID=UPI001ECD6992|nr:hypothetical protein [Shewanella sp.]NRB23000.1 hypothetical protein [Shewanella sp.]
MWFIGRLTELVTIESQFVRDIVQLDLFANIYAVPLPELSLVKRVSLDEAWRESLNLCPVIGPADPTLRV